MMRVRPLGSSLVAACLLVLAGCSSPSSSSGPSAPSNVRTEAVAGGIRVRWDAGGEGVTGYSVERAISSTDSKVSPTALTFSEVGTTPGDTTEFVDHSTDEGTSYLYRVIAKGAGGSSPPGAQANPAVEPLPGVQLDIDVDGTGTVTATVPSAADDDVRSCDASCTLMLAPGTAVELSAAGSDGKSFIGWTGACEGSGTCSLTLDEPTQVGATFAETGKVLNVTLEGDVGGVTVTVSPSATGTGTKVCELQPGDTCSVAYQTEVSLQASVQLSKSTAESGSRFEPFEGCDSSANGDFVYCLVSVPDGLTQVTATVVRPPLSVDDVYQTTEDQAIDVDAAGGLLTNDEDSPDDVLHATLETAPANGDVEVADDGSFHYRPKADFAGSDAFTYTVVDAYGNVSESATVTVQVAPVNDPPVFDLASQHTTIKVGAGAQSVSSFATGIGPGGGADEATQALAFTLATTVTQGDSLAFTSGPTLSADGTLSYTPQPGTFGTATVTATLKDDGGTANGGTDSASHTFDIRVRPIFLDASAGDGGSINVTPAPIQGTSDTGYLRGQQVTITATADPGHRIAAWGGACATTTAAATSCTLTLTADTEVSVTFEEVKILSVAIDPERWGTFWGIELQSTPAGINACTGSCSAAFKTGTKVTVQVQDLPDWVSFAGWSGDCTGAGTCTVDMSEDRSVTAHFIGSWQQADDATGSR